MNNTAEPKDTKDVDECANFQCGANVCGACTMSVGKCYGFIEFVSLDEDDRG